MSTSLLLALFLLLLLSRLLLLLLLHLGHHLLDLVHLHHPHLLPLAHHADLKVLSPALHNLKERLNRQLHCAFLGGDFVGGITLLQKLPHSLGVAADGVSLPLVVGAAGIGLVEARCLVIVEPCDETRNAEWS